MKKINESAENYLETIYVLLKKRGTIRSIDIVHELGYSKPSVSVAMKQLRENGYITIDEDGHISFTEMGSEVAERIFERHSVLTNALISLGVDEETADIDACRVEHVISAETFAAIKDYFTKK